MANEKLPPIGWLPQLGKPDTEILNARQRDDRDRELAEKDRRRHDAHSAGGKNKPPLEWHAPAGKRVDEIHAVHPDFFAPSILPIIRKITLARLMES